MPGIYINDGGETASALSKVLSGIASNYDPKTIAEAQALRYRTEGEDIANQKAAEALQALQNATNQGPAALGQAGGLPGAGGVADTAASLAVPPLVGAYRHPAGTALTSNPYGAQVQNWIQSGQATPEAWRGSILPLGQTMTTGPGTDYNTQTEVAKAKAMPYDLTAGTERHIPGAPGAGGVGGAPTPGGGTAGPGETVVSGPSQYGSSAATSGGQQDPASAKGDVVQGAQAEANLGKLTLVRQIYKQFVVPNTDPAGILTEEVKRKIAATTGIDVTRLGTVGDAKREIMTLFGSMVANLRDNQGQPMFKGGLDQIMSQFPNPDSEPDRFESAVHALELSLAQQKADGDAALEYLKHPSPQAEVELLRAKGQHAAQIGEAFRQAGMSVGQGEAAPGGGPPAPPAPPAAPDGSKPKFVLVPDIPSGMKLPSGTLFRTPDGKPYKVP